MASLRVLHLRMRGGAVTFLVGGLMEDFGCPGIAYGAGEYDSQLGALRVGLQLAESRVGFDLHPDAPKRLLFNPAATAAIHRPIWLGAEMPVEAAAAAAPVADTAGRGAGPTAGRTGWRAMLLLRANPARQRVLVTLERALPAGGTPACRSPAGGREQAVGGEAVGCER